MANAHAPEFVPFEAYLEAEQRASRRHEWVGGSVYVMAGGSERHDVAVNALTDTLRPGARRAGCRTFGGNRLVRTNVASYYPDLLIVCGRPGHNLYETDASLIVEVRSDSTAQLDRREKAIVYATLPSLVQYVLIDPDRRHIEVGTRAGDLLARQVHGPGDVFDTPYGVVVIDELYDAIDAEAFTPPH